MVFRCSGCTHEHNLHRPVILDEATNFFRKHGVTDFTFDSCKLVSLLNSQISIWFPFPDSFFFISKFQNNKINSLGLVFFLQWGWRCRAKLAVRGSSTEPLIGLYEEGTHNVIDIPQCKGSVFWLYYYYLCF